MPRVHVYDDDVNTDVIYPGRYLDTYDPEGMAAHSMEDLDVAFRDRVGEGDLIIGGRNFGCGSSREHAPLALAEAGIRAVVAESYARIFYRNSINGGYLVPFETPSRLVDRIATGDEVELDTELGELTDLTRGERHVLSPLGDVGAIIDAGGVFEYARRSGMLE